MIDISDSQFSNLRKWNLGLTLLHAAQAAIILVLAGDFAITFTSATPDGPPGTRVPQGEGIFDLPIGIAVAVFLALAAFDHLLTATVAKQPYEADLRRGINRFRWVEYSMSATLMVVLIASYSGITEMTAVFAIIETLAQSIFFFSFGLNQWLQYRKIGKWTSYIFGEKTYLVLSLVAKSVLAWQIFGGSLAPTE